MLQTTGNRSNALPRPSRLLLVAVIFIFFCAFLFSTREIIYEAPFEVIEQHVVKQSGGVYRVPDGAPPTVHLVVAATSQEDTSWLKELKVPGMETIVYIADNKSAPHHAQENKGHEAMMYHQYFYDFYDNLADVSILIHSQKLSWHVEQLLDQSMLFSLNHMDMREVQRRQFLNLRVTWGIGCSSGQINTTKVNEESGAIPEQKEMQEAFRANFNIYDIPEILATPCCSQIAVVKELIRSHPREQYKHHIQWLLDTKLDDGISGRTWEHMWQYLFLQKSIDCPIEHRAYCRLYHICFGGREQYDEWIELQQGAHQLREEIQKLDRKMRELEAKSRREQEDEKKRKEENKEGEADEAKGKQEAARKKKERARKNVEAKADERKRQWLEEELATVDEAIRVRKEVAMVRGSVEANRIAEGEDIYGDALEPGLDFVTSPTASPTPAV